MSRIKSDPSEVAARSTRGARVRSLRQSLNLTRPAFAKKFGISIHTLMNWELNRNFGLKEKRVLEVTKIFEQAGIYCPPEWILYGIGNGPSLIDPSQSSMLLAEMETTDNILSTDQELKYIAAELHLFRQHYPGAIDFKITELTMAPRYVIGDHVAGIQCLGADIANAVGKDCIVLTDKQEYLVRELRPGDAANDYTLVCLNTNETIEKPFQYHVKLLMAAPIIWVRRQVFVASEISEENLSC